MIVNFVSFVGHNIVKFTLHVECICTSSLDKVKLILCLFLPVNFRHTCLHVVRSGNCFPRTFLVLLKKIVYFVQISL